VEGRGSQRDEVLVLLPPLVGCCGLWFKQLSFFASLSASSSPHVLALSLPATTELESVAIALGLLLDALSLTQQIHLGGCGLGGYVAQLFCQLRPQRVTSLFLINSFCELPPKTFIPPLSILPSFLVS
jgi:pimeloyl-ACP methyl ester carboxylesterase